ncbi:MAG TPA: PEP-utilizing enzyme [Acidimicrobiales bacterium]|nr:PEP-utilizing enzyme [Acidimicrobiales bacterium]
MTALCRTCHAAIVARELGVPAVVGTADATTALRGGEVVTVSCAEGETGRVYAGEVAFHVERTEIADLERPATEIMINLGDPDLAFKTSFLPNDGVGLARMEFIICESIKVHPLALVHPSGFRTRRRARRSPRSPTGTPTVGTSSSSASRRASGR